MTLPICAAIFVTVICCVAIWVGTGNDDAAATRDDRDRATILTFLGLIGLGLTVMLFLALFYLVKIQGNQEAIIELLKAAG